MDFRPTVVLAALLALGADVPDATHFRTPLPGLPSLSSLPAASALPDIFMAVDQHGVNQPTGLKPASRLAIVRFVGGEFAKAVQPLPGGKNGFKITVGKPVDDKSLKAAVKSRGAAVNPGSTVQITAIEFRAKEIVFQINGGGKKKFRLGEHIQVGVGGGTVNPTNSAPATAAEPRGATLILDFGEPLPDMSPDDLKQDLSAVLDFSREHSATVNWVDTLPPQFKQGIKDRQAVVGMDHEMVIAALGRPDHKVRERDPNGDETEDWIYGSPPAKTLFVTFAGDKVIRVKEFD
jgi:hypothetical protein